MGRGLKVGSVKMVVWNRDLSELRDILADLYPFQDETRRIVEDAGLPTHTISFQKKAIDNWHEILRVAANHGKAGVLAHVALQDYPEHPVLMALVKKFGS